MPVEYWCHFDELNVNIESTVSESLSVRVQFTLWFDKSDSTSVRADIFVLAVQDYLDPNFQQSCVLIEA